MGQRGREYFVRSSARLMDETGASREQIRQLVQREVVALQAESAGPGGATFPALARSCLVLLDQALPPKP